MTDISNIKAPLAGALAALLLAAPIASAQTVDDRPPPRQEGFTETGGYADTLRLLGDDYHVPDVYQEGSSPLTIVELDGRDLLAPSGDKVGDADKVVLGPDGERWLVFDHGGILGFDEEKLALPLSRIVQRGDDLVTRGVTEEDVRNLPGVAQRWEDYPSLDVKGPLGIDLDETGAID